MQKLAYIRFATYALLAVAFAWPKAKHLVIPLNPVAPDDVGSMVNAAIRKEQQAEDVARTPGFETTKKSGSEVLRLAIEHARRGGGDLSQFRTPTVALLRKEGKMKWLVNWEKKGMPMPVGFFAIMIDDDTGAIEDIPGT